MKRVIALSLLLGLACAAAGSLALAQPGYSGLSDGAEKLIPVPSDVGLMVDLWSDPEAGALVHPGDRARIFFRANADCYVTVFSVDTEGRVRLLFPGPREDGWVEGRRTVRLPEPRWGHDLVFAGPPGIEYVYAVASYAPMYDRYPPWLAEGRVLDPDPYWYEEDGDVWETGWVVGDPYYRMRIFCEHLVPDPRRTDSYSTAYLFFHLGRRVSHPRYLCSDCHTGGWIDPYGPACPAVLIRHDDIRCRGWIDFRIILRPRYTYHVHRTWRPRHWQGRDWDGPDGRWVWSSADRRPNLRHQFEDARDIGRLVRDGRPGDERNGWDRGGTPGGNRPRDAEWEKPGAGRPDRRQPDPGSPDRDRPDLDRSKPDRPNSERPDLRNPAGRNLDGRDAERGSPERRKPDSPGLDQRDPDRRAPPEPRVSSPDRKTPERDRSGREDRGATVAPRSGAGPSRSPWARSHEERLHRAREQERKPSGPEASGPRGRSEVRPSERGRKAPGPSTGPSSRPQVSKKGQDGGKDRGAAIRSERKSGDAGRGGGQDRKRGGQDGKRGGQDGKRGGQDRDGGGRDRSGGGKGERDRARSAR